MTKSIIHIKKQFDGFSTQITSVMKSDVQGLNYRSLYHTLACNSSRGMMAHA